MSSLALLTFTRNDVDPAVRMIADLQAHVDEIVVIDSSEDAEHRRLARSLEGSGASVHRVLPVGYVDLLRPYGVAKVRSERVLYLDSDESPSPELLQALRSLDRNDGYEIARYEEQWHGWTRHLRLYRRAAVTFPPESYGYPQVHGSVGKLHPPLHLIHHADWERYLDFSDRAARYLAVESIERPFDGRYLGQALVLHGPHGELRAPGLRGWTGRHPGPLPMVSVHLLLLLEAARDLVTDRSFSGARFRFRYARGKLAYIASLPRAEVLRRRAITEDLRAAGGLVSYLGFRDADYVERLSAGFPWDRSGPQVLRELIDYRYDHGHPHQGEWGTRPDGPAGG